MLAPGIRSRLLARRDDPCLCDPHHGRWRDDGATIDNVVIAVRRALLFVFLASFIQPGKGVDA